MKKLLALVLALVMTLGLATVGASATTFTDDADIDHQEAVEVMNALNIINGMGDGKFDPNGYVTRAQMAKMVTIALLGDVDVSAFTGTATDLKDVGGHWAEAYIKYCYSQGIISGRGNGIFDPNANVTTAEASKMLLVALGYNSDVRKYTGDQWAINVARDAQQRGLYDEISNLTSNKAMDRDDAAQLIYNTLTATRVIERQSVNTETGAITLSYVDATEVAAEANTLLSKSFNAYEFIGIMGTPTYSSTTKEYSYGPDTSWTRKDGSTTFPTQATSTKIFVTKDDYTALRGEEVDVTFMIKNSDVTVLSISATGKTPIFVAEQSKFEAVSSAADKVKVDGTEYAISNTTALVGGTTNPTQANLVSANSHNLVKLVDSSKNGVYDSAVITTITPAKVTYVSSTEVIAGGTSYKTADNNVATGLAKDDYVVVYREIPTAPWTVVKAEEVEGKIDGFKTNKVYVGGTWYNFAGTEFVAANAGKDASFWQYNGVVIADSSELTETSTLDDIVMVFAHDTTGTVQYVRYIDQAGKKATVQRDITSTKGKTLGAPTDGDLYTVKETSDGYQFTAVNADVGDYTYRTSGTTTNGTTGINEIGGKIVADDAVIFVYDSSSTHDAKVITGKQAAGSATVVNANYGTSGQYFTGKSNGLTRVVLATLDRAGAVPSVSDAAAFYALIVDAAYKIDDDYITYKIWDGSDVVTVREKKVAALTERPQFEVISYSKIEDGVIKDVLNYTDDYATSGIVQSYVVGGAGTDTLYIGGEASGNKYKLTGDTKYMYYHADETDADKIGVAGGEIQNADKVGDSYINNVFYVLDGTDIKFILAEVKNNTGTTYTAPTADGTWNTANAPTGFAVTAPTGSYKAGDTITFTGISATGATTGVRFRLESNDGTKVYGTEIVNVPAAGGTTVSVSFKMPADATAKLRVSEPTDTFALTCTNTDTDSDGVWDAAVNGLQSTVITKVTDTTAPFYKGDKVEYTVKIMGSSATTAPTVSGASKVTLTSAATADTSATGVGKKSTGYNLSTSYVGAAFTVIVTAGTSGSFVVENGSIA